MLDIKLPQVTQPQHGPSLSFQKEKELCSRPYLVILGLGSEMLICNKSNIIYPDTYILTRRPGAQILPHKFNHTTAHSSAMSAFVPLLAPLALLSIATSVSLQLNWLSTDPSHPCSPPGNRRTLSKDKKPSLLSPLPCQHEHQDECHQTVSEMGIIPKFDLNLTLK